MGGMPYHLEKGPIFATIEALYNDQGKLPRFLHDLWKGKAAALGALGVITSPSADDPKSTSTSNATPDKRLMSMRRDWFGEMGGQPQPGFGLPPGGRPSTGYWARYHGNVRQIVAETLMRAGELALGVARPDPVPEDLPEATRNWKVEFFWKCGQPRFEGWVTWRRHVGQVGQVTVIFATPATPDQVLSRPAAEADVIQPGAPLSAKAQGMWVCSHSDHEQWVLVTSAPTASTLWAVPISTVMYTRGIGTVGTWAPKYGSGGAPDQPVVFESGHTDPTTVSTPSTTSPTN